jgi:prophage antirepressor-like protein
MSAALVQYGTSAGANDHETRSFEGQRRRYKVFVKCSMRCRLTDGNRRGNPNVNIINEPGLYCLISRSNNKRAKVTRGLAGLYKYGS